MPLLDWQARDGAPIISDRFWIYWAVTIPLTIVVLIVYSTWYCLNDHHSVRSGLDQGSPWKQNSTRLAFEMRVLAPLRLRRLRKDLNGFLGVNTSEELKDEGP